MDREQPNRFALGVLLLSAAGILVKIIGLLYKIPLVALLRDSGMGYFHCAYTIYIFFYTLSTAGLPVAVSILVSGCMEGGGLREAEGVRRKAFCCFTLLGLFLGGGMALGAERLAGWIGNPAAAGCIRLISPVLPLSCMESVLRGYFQGRKEMLPTALSQLLEAVGKLGFGLSLAALAVRQGKDAATAAAYAVMGLFLATLLGLLSLLLFRLRQRRTDRRTKRPPSPKSTPSLRRLLQIALPATVSASVASLSGLLDLGTVMRQLQAAGYSEALANQLYGNYTGLAVPMFNLPPVLITPVAAAILPYMSACLAAGKRQEAKGYAGKAIRYALLLGTPCALGMAAFSEPILRLLYPAGSAEAAAPLLRLLAPGCLFLGLVAVTGAALQAYGYPRLPLCSMLLGAAAKLLCSLLGIPKIGMAAVPLGTCLCYVVAAGCDLLLLYCKTGYFPRPGDFLRPLFAGTVCVVGARLLYLLLPENRVAVLPAIIWGGILYFLTLLGLREPTLREWKSKRKDKKKDQVYDRGMSGAC